MVGPVAWEHLEREQLSNEQNWNRSVAEVDNAGWNNLDEASLKLEQFWKEQCWGEHLWRGGISRKSNSEVGAFLRCTNLDGAFSDEANLKLKQSRDK